MFKTDIDKLNDALIEVRKLEKSIKNDILLKILSLKSDETVKKVSGNMFFINSSNLSPVSWSPEYYNIEDQAQRIVFELEKYESILDIKKKITQFIESGKIIYPNYKILLNDKVIKKLKEIQKELEEIK